MRGRRRDTAATTSTRLRAMARSGPRYAEPENLAVDGVADHGCSELPLGADCQRQRREPAEQDMPGFAAPPTGPNKVGKLASTNTRPPTAGLDTSRRRRRPPLKARVQRASTDDKGPFGFERVIAPAPAASHPRQDSDHRPRTAPRKQPIQRLKREWLCRKQGRQDPRRGQ